MSYSCTLSIEHRENKDLGYIWDPDLDVDIPARYKRAVGDFISKEYGSHDVDGYQAATIYALMCALSAVRPVNHKLFDGACDVPYRSPGYYKIDQGLTDNDGCTLPNPQEDVEIIQKCQWLVAHMLGSVYHEFDTTDLDVLFFDTNDSARDQMRRLLRAARNPDCKIVAHIG